MAVMHVRRTPGQEQSVQPFEASSGRRSIFDRIAGIIRQAPGRIDHGTSDSFVDHPEDALADRAEGRWECQASGT